MRLALAAAGVALLCIMMLSRRRARKDEGRLVMAALSGADTTRALAAIEFLGGAGIYRYRRQLTELAAKETRQPVLDALAKAIIDTAMDRTGDESLANLQLWAMRRKEDDPLQPGANAPSDQALKDPLVGEYAAKMRSALQHRAAAKRPSLGMTVLLIVALFDLVLLVAPPAKGMGNNGDYERIMYQVGLDHADKGSPANAAAHFSPKYRTGVHIDPQIRETYFSYTSSALLLVRGAVAVHDKFNKGGLFDLRWLGVANILALLAGLAMLIASTRQFGPKGRLAVIVLVVLAFSDAAYLMYFNSFFSEPAELAFVLAAVGAAATIANSRMPLVWFAAFVAASTLLITAKAANVAFALPLALAGVFLATRAFKGWGLRMVCWSLTCVLVASGAWMFQQTPQYLERINLYNGIFNGVLMNTRDGAGALENLGLDRDLTHYRGTLAFSPDSGFGKLGDEFFEEVSVVEIGQWYLSHPGSLLKLLSEGAHKSFELRPPDLGNMPRSESRYKVEYADRSLWTLVHRRMLPDSLLVVLGVPLAALVAAVAVWGRRKKLPWASPEVLAAIALMAMGAFALPLIVEGDNEIEKHMFMFNVLFDLCVASLAGLAVNAMAPVIAWAKAKIQDFADDGGAAPELQPVIAEAGR